MKDENIICWVGTKGLIVKDNEVLIIKETLTKEWELPGGKIKHSETSLSREECLAREIREELGENFNIEIGNITDTMFRVFTPSRDPNIDTVFLAVYLCGYLSGEVQKQEGEVLDAVWVNKNNYTDYSYVNGYKAVLDKYFKDR